MNLDLHIITKELCKNFTLNSNNQNVLKNINFQSNRGEFVSVIGRSGSGKTTLLKLLAGLLNLSSGSILINNNTPESARNNKELGFISQNPALLPWYNVFENIDVALKINRKTNQIYDDEKIKDILRFIKLEGIENYYPYQISGGMKQRVAIARSIIYNPDLLIMDEPLSALDEITREEIRYEILGLHEKYNPTIIFSTHNILESVMLSDRVLVLSGKSKNFIEDITIDLPRPRSSSLEDSLKVSNYVNRLKKTIYHDR